MVDAVDLIAEQWRHERPDMADSLDAVHVLGRIHRMQFVFDQHYKMLSDDFGVNAGEFDMLFTLLRTGPPYELTAGSFLKAAMVTSGAMTNRIDRLEAKGLVQRTRDASDRRAVRISLTNKGKDVADKAIAAHLQDYERILAVLSPDEREVIASCLRKILVDQGDTSLS
ncbi:MarR family winged helix-turn-helix transcriptional regulator [Paenarthrobacter sp. NPDC089714]|uniref:MarR family winged helix-turn-helix transcriptional regulator n=1 Tax=Paenarthrobacter sp. NPDC089714 TaxID=3364377 RepID=UPI0037FA06C1